MQPVQPEGSLILNFDNSVGTIKGAVCLDLQAWQEKIRFACSWRDFNAVSAFISDRLPQNYGTVLLGSGDYHHISYFLVKKLGEKLLRQQAAGGIEKAKAAKQSRARPAALAAALPAQIAAGPGAAAPVHVVILDNHPDNMRYPFGIHCGSWVSHLAALPFVARIDVLGITSSDIAPAHAWENRLLPLWRGKLRYWSVGVDTGWARWLGLRHAFRNFAAVEDMAAAFTAEQAGRTMPVYLSLDKDVLAPALVHTNWDQGIMAKETLIALLTALKSRIIAGDIVGEVSEYRYKSPFKRVMSALDGQARVLPAELSAWQRVNQVFNRQILPFLP
ncbi:MAG: hypothetical protein DU429_04135 [Candidatus Tokpelaia sp.]|nr:MAG: hypothetical protein DU430_06240 [Candidatus Tokpelaia sp.]KAA6207041.1 MAG: hypothetical protein DU429_04135 [Candidatus Tokpelaia sp.]